MVSFADGQFYQLSVSPIVNFTDSFADAGETSNLMCGRMFEKVSTMVISVGDAGETSKLRSRWIFAG